MAGLPGDLSEALASELVTTRVEQLSGSVRRLMRQYRSNQVADRPILSSGADVAAYAAYRMPATFAAGRAALLQLSHVLPAFRPQSHLDVGGGTGAAAWAATQVFPSLTTLTVLDQVTDALSLGQRLTGRAGQPALRAATWRQWSCAAGSTLPSADLVTISYVLGELPAAARSALLTQAVATRGVVVIIEPGTPAGYQRILTARSALIDNAMTILAPCPHQHLCPVAGSRDWCHFAARIDRSALHRRLKQAQLGHEDEKFSYLAAAPLDTGHTARHRQAQGRILRHPQYRKGLVSMQICAADGTARQELVSKRQSEVYRQARGAAWGDPWPPDPAA